MLSAQDSIECALLVKNSFSYWKMRAKLESPYNWLRIFAQANSLKAKEELELKSKWNFCLVTESW